MLSDEDRRLKARLYQQKRRSNIPRKTQQEITEIHRTVSPKKKPVLRSDGTRAESARAMARLMGIGHSEITRAIKRNLRVRGYTFNYV